MTRPSRVFAALLAALSCFVPWTARAGDDADDVLEDIYEIVEKACPEDGEGLPYNLANVAREYFDAGAQHRLARAYDTGALDFDVLIDAPDCAIPDLDIETGAEAGGEALGRVSFTNMGEPRRIDVILRKSGGAWKVHDIIYRHRDWVMSRDVR